MRRLYPLAVTISGGLGLGLALTYFVGVFAAFAPGWEDWAEFFVPNALYLLIPPYGLLIAHLVLRNHVGRFLLRRCAYGDAFDYASKRLNAPLFRSKREIANHRMVCARARMGRGEYEEAAELLAELSDEAPGAYAMEARRWQFEIALRQDDRERAEELVIDEPREAPSARGETVAVLACEAELALRNEDWRRFEQRLRDAMWERPDHPRGQLCRAMGMLEDEPEELAGEAAEILESIEEPIGAEIPARRAELQALRALAVWRNGESNEAQQLLDRAREGPADEWTERVLERVAEALADVDE